MLTSSIRTNDYPIIHILNHRRLRPGQISDFFNPQGRNLLICKDLQALGDVAHKQCVSAAGMRKNLLVLLLCFKEVSEASHFAEYLTNLGHRLGRYSVAALQVKQGGERPPQLAATNSPSRTSGTAVPRLPRFESSKWWCCLSIVSTTRSTAPKNTYE